MWYLVCHNKYSRQQKNTPHLSPFRWLLLLVLSYHRDKTSSIFSAPVRAQQSIIPDHHTLSETHCCSCSSLFHLSFIFFFSSISFFYNGPRYSHPRSSAPSTTREEVLSLHTRLHPTRFSPLVPAQHPCHFSPPLALPPRSIDLPCHSIFPLLPP